MSRTAALLPAFSVFLLLSAAGAQGQTSQPTVQGPEHYDVSPPLRDIPASTGARTNKRVIVVRHGEAPGRPIVVHDPARQTVAGPLVNTAGGLNFDAQANADSVAPPDTNMAVGPNHIVQWVNLSLAVYDKSGNILPGYPKEGNSIWTGFGGDCDPTSSASNGGDIIAKYDRANGRWVLSQLAFHGFDAASGAPLPPFHHCIAVSTSGDPTGSYHRYDYSFGNNLTDYPKMAIWPDAYYASYNIFPNANTFSNAEACAYDGAAMRAGMAAKQICFNTPSPSPSINQICQGHGSLQPSDLDGPTAPPAGSPNFYLNLNCDTNANGSTLSLWKFHVDFATPSNSTFTGPIDIGVASFSGACGGGTCIPQQGTIFNGPLDSLGERLMYRLAYRNFGDHEAMVVNHSVTSGSAVGVRWYEIRSPNSTPVVFQQGTFDPGDGNYRWMGSAAMDHAGDIAIGYSVSSNNLYPSISYTGRVPSDPANTMETEASIVVGGSWQFLQNRWGDYSDMVIDPSDDCTFWYTTEYTKSGSTWQTRIASFKFPTCGQNLTGTTTTLGSSQNASVYGQAVTFTATVAPTAGGGTPTGAVTFKDGAATLGTGTLSGGQATYMTSSLAAGSHSITAVYGGDANFSTSTSSTLTQTVNQASTTTTVGSSANPSASGQPVTFTATVTAVAPGAGTPTGTVNFQDNGTTIGTGTLNGSGQATYMTSSLTVASHPITAVYGGDTNFGGSTSSTLTQSVNQASTTSAVVSSASPSVFGQSVTFTATVAAVAPGGGTPTGTVTFKDGGATLGTGALSGGQATYATSSLAVASHLITAVYGGDTNFGTSTSSTLTQTVSQASTTTTVGSSANPSSSGQPVTFTATVTAVAPGAGTPTGTVTFKDGATTLSTQALSGGQATLTTSSLTVASHSITAVYGGDTNFGTSTSSTLTQTVNPVKTNTTTGLAPSVNPSVFGQSVTFTATVAPTSGSGTPTGTVTFKDGATTLGTGTLSGGQATYMTSGLAVGGHSITAVYGGDTNFNTSTSSALSQGVNQASTTTAVVSSGSPSVFGQSVTFTATVAPMAPGAGTPTGTVTFKDGGTTLGSGALNGSGQATYTTSSLAVGSHSITAAYGGDTSFSGSTSSALSQTVNNAPPPAAPVLTVGSPTRNSLTLTWTEDTSTAPVSSFDVLRCTGSCTPTTVVASGLAGTTRSYRNSGLSRHTTYSYRVRANNSGGSTPSNITSGRTN